MTAKVAHLDCSMRTAMSQTSQVGICVSYTAIVCTTTTGNIALGTKVASSAIIRGIQFPLFGELQIAPGHYCH